MADPVTMAAIGIGSSIASAGLGAYSALESGDAKSKAFEYQAGVAQINASIARDNADKALYTGEQQAMRLGMGQRDRMGKITVAQAASGIDINSGSPAAVRNSQATVDRMDQEQVRENASRKAYGHLVEAEGHKRSGEMARSAGADAEWAGKIGAATSILGGVSSVSSKWSQGTQVGLFGGSGGASPGMHPYDEAIVRGSSYYGG